MQALRRVLFHCCITTRLYLNIQTFAASSYICSVWWSSPSYQRQFEMSGTSSGQKTLLRLDSIAGQDDKLTDVLYCGDQGLQAVGDVIFFGGDVQDYPEVMATHRDNKRYVAWNIERTATILSDRFPRHNIWLIKPYRMHLKTFSVYSNFVESDNIGCPDHSTGQSSWHQLGAILKNSYRKRREIMNTMSDFEESEQIPLTIVAFSKGVVVLNQLLYDLEAAKTDISIKNFVNRVEALYWLDGGHNGGSNTWITTDEVLHALDGMDISIYSHVTPYQIQDPMRKWIRKEQKKFVQKLKDLNVKITNTVHFADDERSIDNHFKVLTVF